MRENTCGWGVGCCCLSLGRSTNHLGALLCLGGVACDLRVGVFFFDVCLSLARSDARPCVYLSLSTSQKAAVAGGVGAAETGKENAAVGHGSAYM